MGIYWGMCLKIFNINITPGAGNEKLALAHGKRKVKCIA